MSQLTIVGLREGLSAPSRTLSLVEPAVDAVARASGRAGPAPRSGIIDVAALPGIGQLRTCAEAAAPEEDALEADPPIIGRSEAVHAVEGLVRAPRRVAGVVA